MNRSSDSGRNRGSGGDGGSGSRSNNPMIGFTNCQIRNYFLAFLMTKNPSMFWKTLIQRVGCSLIKPMIGLKNDQIKQKYVLTFLT